WKSSLAGSRGHYNIGLRVASGFESKLVGCYILSSEPLHIFDPRRNLQLQGFAGRAATTTMHDATETGVSISGIFQAAEDFAVLGWWNAYDYFNHLRCRHLPKTDLSGLKLEFDIEYDQALDGAMRFDAA